MKVLPFLRVLSLSLVGLALRASPAEAARGERSRGARDLQQGSVLFKGATKSKEPLDIFRTPEPSSAPSNMPSSAPSSAPSNMPSSAPTSSLERFFEIDLEVAGDDGSILFNAQDEIAEALLVGYNTLADDLDDPFNVRMTSAQLNDIILVTDDGRRLRRTQEDVRRVLQTTNATDAPRRRSRATASLTSRGICNGCPPSQRFTTSVATTRRLMRRALQDDDVPTLDALLGAYNAEAEDIDELEEATGIREFDVPPTLSPTSAPSATPSSKPSSKPSSSPSSKPSSAPSSKPSAVPSSKPSSKPSAVPSSKPSSKPSAAPSSKPSAAPSSKPSAAPSSKPSSMPSSRPTLSPTPAPTKESTSKSKSSRRKRTRKRR